MYKSVRKKVAESLSKVDLPEQYDWNKWLRVPLSDDLSVEPFYTRVIDTNDIILGFIVPTERGFTFDLPRIKISKAFKQLVIQKQKTNKIFFSFPSSLTQSIKEILSAVRVIYSLSISLSDKGSIYRIIDGQNKEIQETATEISSIESRIKSPRTSDYPLLLPSEKVILKDVALISKPNIYDLLSNLKT